MTHCSMFTGFLRMLLISWPWRSGAWTIWTMLPQSFHCQPTTCSPTPKIQWQSVCVCFPLYNGIWILYHVVLHVHKTAAFVFISLLVLCLFVSLVFHVFSSLCCLAGCFSMCTVSTDWLINWLIDWLIDWSMDRAIHSLIHWFMVWLVGCLVDTVLAHISSCSGNFWCYLGHPWCVNPSNQIDITR